MVWRLKKPGPQHRWYWPSYPIICWFRQQTIKSWSKHNLTIDEDGHLLKYVNCDYQSFVLPVSHFFTMSLSNSYCYKSLVHFKAKLCTVFYRHSSIKILTLTVYPKKYAHGFVVLCFVVVMQSFIMNSHKIFIHIHQGCFAGTGAIVGLPQCQWSKPDGYLKISECITTTKHSKAKTVCIFLGIYCSLALALHLSEIWAPGLDQQNIKHLFEFFCHRSQTTLPRNFTLWYRGSAVAPYIWVNRRHLAICWTLTWLTGADRPRILLTGCVWATSRSAPSGLWNILLGFIALFSVLNPCPILRRTFKCTLIMTKLDTLCKL